MIPFLKMHGCGNDFVVLDNRGGDVPALDWQLLANRNLGIGCDQLLVLENSKTATVRMRIFNADGKEAKSCGNASRCVAWLVREQATNDRPVSIETLGGTVHAWIKDELHVTVDMGEPVLEWEKIPLTYAPLTSKKDTLHLRIGLEGLHDPVAVSMGNPHMIFFVLDAKAVALDKLGPSLERHSLFPDRANVNVAQVVAKDNIILRVWERGAGLTLACGTGACATLVAACRRGLTGRKATVSLPGGALEIEWREEDNHVLMTGAVATSFKGEIDAKAYGA